MDVSVTLNVRIKGIKQLRENLPALTRVSPLLLCTRTPPHINPPNHEVLEQVDLRIGQPPCSDLFPTLLQLVRKKHAKTPHAFNEV